MQKRVGVYQALVNHMAEHITLGDIVKDIRDPRGLSKGEYGKSLVKGKKPRRK